MKKENIFEFLDSNKDGIVIDVIMESESCYWSTSYFRTFKYKGEWYSGLIDISSENQRNYPFEDYYKPKSFIDFMNKDYSNDGVVLLEANDIIDEVLCVYMDDTKAGGDTEISLPDNYRNCFEALLKEKFVKLSHDELEKFKAILGSIAEQIETKPKES